MTKLNPLTGEPGECLSRHSRRLGLDAPEHLETFSNLGMDLNLQLWIRVVSSGKHMLRGTGAVTLGIRLPARPVVAVGVALSSRGSSSSRPGATARFGVRSRTTSDQRSPASGGTTARQPRTVEGSSPCSCQQAFGGSHLRMGSIRGGRKFAVRGRRGTCT